jgi:hypothetical protein
VTDDDVPPRTLLIGLVQTLVIAGFIGVTIGADIELPKLVFGWIVVIGGLALLNRWKR